MLLTDKLVFLHIPRTGGSWVYKVLALSLKDTSIEIIPGHEQMQSIGHLKKNKTVFTFVRNPIDWYASYWNRRASLGWSNQGLDKFKSKDLNDFVNKVIKTKGNYCTTYFSEFTEGANFVGKYENLVEDLIKVLKDSKSKFDEDLIRSYKPMNCSDFIKFSGEYTKETVKKIINVEKSIFKQYKYETDLSKISLKYNKIIKDGTTQKKHGDEDLNFLTIKVNALHKGDVRKLAHGDKDLNKITQQMKKRMLKGLEEK